MRFISLILLGFIALTSCQTQPQTETKKADNSIFNKGTVIVEGQIDNAPDKQVDLYLEELTGLKIHTSKTDSTGHFKFKVELLSEHDNGISIEDWSLRLYLKPGDSIFIKSDLKDDRESTQFLGDNVRFNTLIHKYQSLYTKELMMNFIEKKKGVNPQEFKKLTFDFLDKQEARLDSVAKEINPTPEEIEWLKRNMLYKRINYLLGYKWDYAGELPKDIDLVFLDINMPEISGLSFARSINPDIKVIFTTAYREYAIDGFDLKAVDYLLKPISFERFLQAINKYISENSKIHHTEYQHKQEERSDFFFVRADRKMHKIEFNKILYIESISDYLSIHLIDKTVTTRETISNIEAKLPQLHFIRVHRSFIVAFSAIDSFTNEYIELGKHQIPISRSYKAQVWF